MNKTAFLICATGWGGLEMHSLKMFNWLTGNGQKISLYLTKNTTIHQKAKELNVPYTLIKRSRKYLDVYNAFLFAKMLKAKNEKTLVVFDNKDLDFAFFTKLFYKSLKVIYQQHMQVGIDKKDFLHTLRFNSINIWVTPLSNLKEQVISRTKVPSSKIKVIPYGIEVNKFNNVAESIQTARKKLHIQCSNVPLIGILGRIDPMKGQLFILMAIHHLILSGTKVKLLIMGDATIDHHEGKVYEQKIKDYISAHKLESDVYLKSFRDDVIVFYKAVDLCALASDNETYGLVAIESLLAGTPVISNTAGGIKEILEHGELGILYKPGDIEDFCVNVKKLLNNPKEMQTLTDKGRERAILKYTHVNECNEWEKMLNSIIQE